LGQLINQHNVDITYIQEPYTINNKLAGLARGHKVYTSGDGRNRNATVINNDQLAVTLITKSSNEDCVAVEVRSEAVKLYNNNNNNNKNNNNYYYYLLQLGCHPVAVVILHVNKT
jgi:hypothetical protein